MRPQSLRILFVLFCLLVLALIPARPATSQGCLYADFDDDGDPWTLRTELPPDIPVATMKLILEVPQSPPLDRYFWIDVIEGCCNDPDNNGHHGVGIDAMTIEVDPAIVDWFSADLPTCTYCCPWIWHIHIRQDAPLVPDQRYFIAEATARVVCTEYDPPCYPPHDITLSYHLDDGDECPPGEAYLLMACPPTAERPASWGRVRGLYR